METVTAPTKLPPTDTSLKAHNEANIAHGPDANGQQCPIDCDIPMQKAPLTDELLRATELAFDNDIAMAEPTNAPAHAVNGRHSQAHKNWTDNKENTKLSSDLDRLIQKSDAQLYDEFEKVPVIKTLASVKVCEEADAHSGSHVHGSGDVCNGDADIDMISERVVDERDDVGERDASDTHIRQTRARSESPKMCDNQRTRNTRMRRRSQPVSEVSVNRICLQSQMVVGVAVGHLPTMRIEADDPLWPCASQALN